MSKEKELPRWVEVSDGRGNRWHKRLLVSVIDEDYKYITKNEDEGFGYETDMYTGWKLMREIPREPMTIWVPMLKDGSVCSSEPFKVAPLNSIQGVDYIEFKEVIK